MGSRILAQTQLMALYLVLTITQGVSRNPGSNVSPFAVHTDGLDWKESGFKSEIASGVKGDVAGFWDCCCLAIFSYTGNELVAIAAWETEYPRYTLPKAVKRVTYRIVFYYTSAIFVLGFTVSSRDPLLLDTSQYYPGGFILMAERAGIPIVPH